MFKKSSKNYKQVRLSCPFCGSEQSEPTLAVSSFCRSCGEHFRIANGIAVAPPGARVSGISPIVRKPAPRISNAEETSVSPPPQGDFPVFQRRTAKPPEDAPTPGQTWLHAIREKTLEQKRAAFSEKTQPIRPQSVESEVKKSPAEAATAKKSKPPKKTEKKAPKSGKTEDSQSELKLDGVESGSKAKSSPPESDSDAANDPNELGAAAQPFEQLKAGNMAALLGGALEKLKFESHPPPESSAPPASKMPPNFVPAAKRKGGNDPKMRPVRCFECNHQQLVSAMATSTQCARCSVYIRLVDHEITTPWSQNIRTRGNVRVHRKGSVTGCDVACHNLVVQGNLSASVDCSGDAVFRHSAKVIGNMHCKHLVVEKKSEVDFPQGLIAESADVYGTIRGNMTCSGRIRIFKTGSVVGDAMARSVVLNDGGVLTGQMSIQPDLVITLPEKKGYLNQ